MNYSLPLPVDSPYVVEEALSCAAIGLKVVPLHHRSKTPILERWPERATTKAETIMKWFSDWPDANLAIMTGGGIIGLDVDPRNGGALSLKKLIRRRRMPETAQTRTGAGGDHFLFRVGADTQVATTDGFMPGLDIKADGGLLVVEPSFHPTTRREYVWLRRPEHGIARAPEWLLRQLPRVERREDDRPSRPLRCIRTGEGSSLVARMVERFPVEGHGDRHRQMTRAIGSLIGHQYEPHLVHQVMMDWHAHFADLGLTAMSHKAADREIAACIRSTLKNPEFKPALAGISHRARIAEIQLSQFQQALIEQGIIQGGEIVAAPSRTLTPPCISITSGEMDLCRTEQERAFVRAFTVYMTYKVGYLGEQPPKMTHRQIGDLVHERSGLMLTCVQFERLLVKYVTRPEKPATRFELAVQTAKGRPGIPSEYELTGMLQLITAVGHLSVAA